MNEQNLDIPNWEEIRFAYQVARLGTLSAAALALGVHHATVIRRIDALEARLGVKLFQRHPRGYTATEAGRDLLAVASATEDGLAQMVGRIKGRGAQVRGELIITILPTLTDMMTPKLARFMQTYPDLQVTVIAEERRARLEYGEAHVALRAGREPQEPDNVVQKLTDHSCTLYAHKDYVDRYGALENLNNLSGHRFIGYLDPQERAPFIRWMNTKVPADQIVYRTNTSQGIEAAIQAGIGIGFSADDQALRYPDWVKMCDPLPDWPAALWLVTHRDLHRTAKVQAFVAFLKSTYQAEARL